MRGSYQKINTSLWKIISPSERQRNGTLSPSLTFGEGICLLRKGMSDCTFFFLCGWLLGWHIARTVGGETGRKLWIKLVWCCQLLLRWCAGRLVGEIPFHVTQELTLEPIFGLTFEECRPSQDKKNQGFEAGFIWFLIQYGQPNYICVCSIK